MKQFLLSLIIIFNFLINIYGQDSIQIIEKMDEQNVNFFKLKIHNSSIAIKKEPKKSGLFNKRSPWMFYGGYTYQNEHILNIGARKTNLDISGNHSDGQYGMSLMVYYFLDFVTEVKIYPETQLSTKFGIGYYLAALNGSINVITYNDNFKEFYPAILPEIGLSWWLVMYVANLNYGRNIYLTDVQNKPIHRLTFYITGFLNPKKVW